ncbi:hypothetical protein F9B16_13145 [Actinomadura montaniterrae]|uniref:Uncharacterized protein n=1 Tax=Actinomadura montaniterrae TaxID=1803903 RepID=A0A6L3VW60_9ACTN|nr:hypothetical protein F9B16_13145 [Actinomadura montaniterrae]
MRPRPRRPTKYRDTYDLVHRREAKGLNEIWQADHTELDIWVIDDTGTSCWRHMPRPAGSDRPETEGVTGRAGVHQGALPGGRVDITGRS